MSHQYEYIINKLKQNSSYSPLVVLLWEKSPSDLEESKKIKWFLEKLFDQGLVAEDIIEEICEELLANAKPVTVDESIKKKQFGRFLLLEKLGEGGMGKVYKAYDPNLKRDVAIKMLLAGNLNDKIMKRFQQEAQIMAKFRHPNIIHLYEVGSENNIAYISMEYIKGCSLEDFVANNGSLEITQSLEIIRKVALAVSVAHEHNIIHRDLKPANIILKENFEPVVTDFGLAKDLGDKSSITNSSVLGTPSYMSPEQVQGKLAKVGYRSDVFSLGTIFYQILTGVLPFTGKNSLELMVNILEHEPFAPSVLKSQLDRDIETICLKCLEKDPQHRYTSASELAQDIVRFQNNKVILAKPASLWHKVRKWLRRNKTLTWLTLITITVIAATLVLYVSSLYQFSLQRLKETETAQMRLANIAIGRAKQAHKNFEWRTCGALCGAALQFVQKIQTPTSNKLKEYSKNLLRVALERHAIVWYHIDPGVLHKITDYPLVDFSNKKKILEQLAPYPAVKKMGMKSNEHSIMTSDQRFFAISFTNKIEVWDLPKNEMILQIPIAITGKMHMAFSPDKQHLAFFSNHKTIELWNIFQKKKTEVYKVEQPDWRGLNIATFNNDGKFLIYTVGATIVVRSRESGKVVHRLFGHTNDLMQLLLVPNDDLLISCATDYTVRVWDLNTGKQEKIYSDSKVDPICVALSHSKKILAIGYHDGKIKLWDFEMDELIHVYQSSPFVFALKFSADDCHLLARSFFHCHILTCWRVFYPKHIATLPPENYFGIDVSEDESLFVTTSGKNVNLWNMDTVKKIATFPHSQLTNSAVIHHSKKIVASSCEDHKIRLWDVEKRKLIKTLDHGFSLQLLFHPQQKNLLVFGDKDDNVVVYNIYTNQSKKFNSRMTKIEALSFSNDGEYLALLDANQHINIWNFANWKLKQSFDCHGKIVDSNLQFTPDNQYLLYSSSLLYSNPWCGYIHDIVENVSYSVSFAEGGVHSSYLDSIILGGYPVQLLDLKTKEPYQSFCLSWVGAKFLRVTSSGKLVIATKREMGIFQLPSFPQYKYSGLPIWTNQFPLACQAQKHPSKFDLRQEVPGWFIESAVAEAPLKITEILFNMIVGEDLLVNDTLVNDGDFIE
ncbi:WD40 repeat domain-containing serine/threonine protein kinase [Candidatus Uabimicrobium sp. HlEnr_7]|uniref:WD40 repeat domain-containing serine/threonine protein kinase n=1 Tax=Candidatus Uabimicrobium helgolandensis TaxID=3095367 RepID=UPI00355796DA